MCWGTALIATKAWTWPVPKAAATLLGSVLLLAVAALAVAATSRHSYRRTRLAAGGGIAVIAIDVTMLTIALLVTAHGWPITAAVTVSLARIAMTARVLPRTLSP